MKVDTDIDIAAPPKAIWDSLLDFAAYPRWNGFLRTVVPEDSAPLAFDSRLRLEIQYRGESIRRRIVKVTAHAPEKYLSWSFAHSFGAFWLFEEHVFRLKTLEEKPGLTRFYQELYVTGLSIRFGRSGLKSAARLSMEKMNNDFKEWVEGAGRET